MTTPSGVRTGVGARDFQIFLLDSSGYPVLSTTTTVPYEGVDVSGIRQVTFTVPETRQITFYGDDRTFALDTLPPTDAVSGEMQVQKIDNIILALVSGQSNFTVGDTKMFGWGTDHQGSEPQVGMLTYQQAQEADESTATFGKRLWNFVLAPKCFIYPKLPSMDDNPATAGFTIRPQFCMSHIWGTSFATATEGFGRAQVLTGVSEYRPHLCSYVAAAASTATLTLPSGIPVVTTAQAKLSVWVNGVSVSTASYSIPSTTQFVINDDAPQTTGSIIVVFYESSIE